VMIVVVVMIVALIVMLVLVVLMEIKGRSNSGLGSTPAHTLLNQVLPSYASNSYTNAIENESHCSSQHTSTSQHIFRKFIQFKMFFTPSRKALK
jgi:hypothetical protein